MLKKIIIAVAMVLGLVAPMAPVLVSEPAYADCVDTNLFGNCVPIDNQGGGIKKLVGLALNVVLYGIGVAAVIGVVIAGITYLTARDNEAQMVKARTRLIEVAIGLLVWAMLFAVLQWLIPGFSESKVNEYTGAIKVDSAELIA